MSQTKIVSHEPFDQKYISSKLITVLSKGWYEYTNKLLGEVLTIVDASIQDQEQRKAVKDLIRKSFFLRDSRDESYINYAMASLSKFLRTLRNESSTEEEEHYQKYLEIFSLTSYSGSLEKELKALDLG